MTTAEKPKDNTLRGVAPPAAGSAPAPAPESSAETSATSATTAAPAESEERKPRRLIGRERTIPPEWVHATEEDLKKYGIAPPPDEEAESAAGEQLPSATARVERRRARVPITWWVLGVAIIGVVSVAIFVAARSPATEGGAGAQSAASPAPSAKVVSDTTSAPTTARTSELGLTRAQPSAEAIAKPAATSEKIEPVSPKSATAPTSKPKGTTTVKTPSPKPPVPSSTADPGYDPKRPVF